MDAGVEMETATEAIRRELDAVQSIQFVEAKANPPKQIWYMTCNIAIKPRINTFSQVHMINSKMHS